MRIPTTLALMLTTATAIFGQAPAATPTLGQRLAAERPEIKRLQDAFEFEQAQARAEALLPTAKPVFDKTSVLTAHQCTRSSLDVCQAYFLAFQAADNNGQWEKGLEYLTLALEVAKDSAESGRPIFTQERDNWQKQAAFYRAKVDRNADAIQALKAKAKLEDYELESMALVTRWEKDIADFDSRAKFYQVDLDLAARNVDAFVNYVKLQTERIKDLATQIDEYKAHPGDKAKWVEGVVSSKTYLVNTYPDKADRIAFVHRLLVLDPASKKAQNTLDVLMGRAAPEKEKPAPRKKK